jgi:hypothetical protein
MAKPVLVSNAKPLARIVRECSCGFVFTSGDPADAAAKIEKAYALRGDPEMRLRYTWVVASGGLVQAYEKPAVSGRGEKPR